MASRAPHAKCLFFGPSTTSTTSWRDCNKIKHMDAHPVRSWIATADESGLVVVWDYRLKTTVCQLIPQHAEDMLVDFQALQNSTSEVLEDFDAIRPASAKKLQVGMVKGLRFYDQDTLEWYLDCHTRTPHAWLVIVSEHQVLLHDYITQEEQRIVADDLSKQQPSCAEPLSATLLAIGCPDGNIRIWDIQNVRVVKVLQGAHQKHGVTRIISTPLPVAKRPPIGAKQRFHICSVGSDGSIACWDIAFVGNIVESKFPSALLIQQEQEPLVDISYDMTMGVLMTAGSSRIVSLWDRHEMYGDGGAAPRPAAAAPLKRTNSSNLPAGTRQLRPLVQKKVVPTAGSYEALTYFRHPHFLPHCVLACPKGPELELLNLSTDSKPSTPRTPTESSSPSSPFFQLCTLMDMRARFPAKLKIYQVLQHPLQDQLVMCAANIGIFVLSIDDRDQAMSMDGRYASHPKWHSGEIFATVVGHSLRLQRPVPSPPTSSAAAGDATAGGAGARAGAAGAAGAAATVQLASDRTMASPLQPPPATPTATSAASHLAPQLLPSPSGDYLALVWPDLKCYQVLSVAAYFGSSGAGDGDGGDGGGGGNPNAKPTQVETGSCTSFAWAAHDDTFCILEPGARIAKDPSAAAKKKGRRRSTEAIQMIQLPPRVTLKRVSSDSKCAIVAIDLALLKPAAFVLGGALLCVGYAEPLAIEYSEAVRVSSAGMGQGGGGGGQQQQQKADDPFWNARSSQFFTWEVINQSKAGASEDEVAAGATETTLQAFGPELPCPDFLLWNSEATRCLHVLNGSMRIYRRSQNAFEPMCCVEGIGCVRPQSALWHHGSLFFCTYNEVCCLFPAEDSYCSLILASSCPWKAYPLPWAKSSQAKQFSSASDMSVNAMCGELGTRWDSLCPPQQLRPPGQLKVLRVAGNILLLADSGSRYHTVRLDTPMTSFGILATAGAPEHALKWAHAIEPRLHDSLAAFLEQRGMLTAALRVPGITSMLKLGICIRHRLIGPVIQMIADKEVISQCHLAQDGTFEMNALRHAALLLYQNASESRVANALRDLLGLCEKINRVEDAAFIGKLVHA